MNHHSAFACITGIITFIIVCSSYQTTLAQSWVRDTVSVGNYTILMPENSQQQVRETESDVGTLEIHISSYEDDNGGYLVSYTEYPWSLINSRSEAEIFDGVINGLGNSMNGELIDRSSIMYEGYSGVEPTFVIDDYLKLRSKFYLIENRIYQLTVIGSESMLINKSTTRFFNSLEVLDLETIETTFIERLLNEIDYEYSIDDDNDYNVIIEFDDGRSQVVYITATISSLTSSEKYDVWSIIGTYDDLPASKLAGDMFLVNGNTEIGQFQSFETDSGFLLAYSALYHGTLNAGILETLINEIASISDNFETQLMDGDPY